MRKEERKEERKKERKKGRNARMNERKKRKPENVIYLPPRGIRGGLVTSLPLTGG